MNQNALTLLDWAIVLLYLVTVVTVGLRVKGRQKSSADYFLGSRSLPGWALGMSMFATMTSTWAFLALPAKGFHTNLTYLMAISALPIAAWIGARWFIPMFREKIKLTAYEFLDRRFGTGAKLYGSLTFLIVHFGKMAAILYLLCLALAELTGFSVFTLIFALGTAAVVYSVMGGIEGVVWADVIEGSLLLFAGVASIGFILLHTPGGASAVVGVAADARKFAVASPDFDWAKPSTVALFFFSLNYYTQKYVGDQTVVQRYLLAPSSRQAGRALWVSSFLVMMVWVLFMGLGVLLWSFYNLQPELLPDAVRAKPDKVFSHFIGHQLPTGISGLIIAGLMSGSLGSLASDLNSFSAVLYTDFYQRLRAVRTDAHQLLFSRVAVAVTGALTMAFAMTLTNIESMADAAINFVSIVGGGILGMYLLGMVSTRASKAGLYIGLAAGVLMAIWGFWCGPGSSALAALPRFPLHGLWIGPVSNVVVFTVGYLASLCFPRRIPPPVPAVLEEPVTR